MVTGDDVVTGAAIAEKLGIPGEAILGSDFAALADDELWSESAIPFLSPIARLSRRFSSCSSVARSKSPCSHATLLRS